MPESPRKESGSVPWKSRLRMGETFKDEAPPIYKLPDDILRCIFLLNSMNSVMSSSQVCQRWRTAALQNRKVWLRFIDWIYSPLAWIEELLRRSDPCLFDFGDFNRGEMIELAARFRVGRRDDDVLSLILGRTTRLRSFCVKTTYSGVDSVVSSLISCPVPNLEYLGLLVVDKRGAPEILSFDLRSPLLRHLHLGQLPVGIVPKSILLPLVTFRFTRGHTEIGFYMVAEWLGILADMPALQHLVIEDMMVLDTDAPAEALSMVHLDHLETLVVNGPFHETMTLLSCLTLPPRCSFDLSMSSSVLGPDERTLATLLERHLSSWGQDSPLRALLAYYKPGQILFTNKHRLLKEEHLLTRRCVPLAKDDPLFCIELFLGPMQDRVQESLRLFFFLFRVYSPTFPTTKILSLGIATNRRELRDPFIRLVHDYFHLFATLHTFEVRGSPGSLVLPLLQLASSSADESLSPNRRMLFPGLKTVLHTLYTPLIDEYATWRARQGFPVEVLAC